MNKFTETATGALNRALECARELGHTFIGSQHLLYGLAAQEGGLAQNVLNTAGVQAPAVLALIERYQQRQYVLVFGCLLVIGQHEMPLDLPDDAQCVDASVRRNDHLAFFLEGYALPLLFRFHIPSDFLN